MKNKILLCCLALCLAVLFVGCEMLDERYVPLIDAIEQDDYKEALQILQDLMDVDPNSGKKPTTDKESEAESETDSEGDNGGGFGNEETTGSSDPVCTHDFAEGGMQPNCTEEGIRTLTCRLCGTSETERIPALGHDMSEATCTKASTCNRCSHREGNALGHSYVNAVCTRCGEEDPDAARTYASLLDRLAYFVKYGSCSDLDYTQLNHADSANFLISEFTALGDYKDCAEIVSRFHVYRDRLTSLRKTSSDLIGNNSSSEYQYVTYDALGRVIKTSDDTILRQFCVLQNSKMHCYIKIDYVDNTVDSKVAKVTVVWVGISAIMTPIYEGDRIIAMHILTNDLDDTLKLEYDDQGRIVYAELYEEWTEGFYAQRYTYSASGEIASVSESQKVVKASAFENASLKWYNTEYALDENGNRLNFTYREDGKVLTETYVQGSETIIYEYIYEDVYRYLSPDA